MSSSLSFCRTTESNLKLQKICGQSWRRCWAALLARSINCSLVPPSCRITHQKSRRPSKTLRDSCKKNPPRADPGVTRVRRFPGRLRSQGPKPRTTEANEAKDSHLSPAKPTKPTKPTTKPRTATFLPKPEARDSRKPGTATFLQHRLTSGRLDGKTS